jgi:hypothetical protein
MEDQSLTDPVQQEEATMPDETHCNGFSGGTTKGHADLSWHGTVIAY